MARQKLLFVSIFLLSMTVNSGELIEGSQIGFALGNTYVAQNIGPLAYSELYLNGSALRGVAGLPSNLLSGIEVNLGLLSASGGKGHLIGVGPKIGVELLDSLVFSGAFRFVYLDEFRLRSSNSLHMRNYGGHRQFQYYWELVYRPSASFSVGYRWLHMSNGMQVLPEELKYDHNPVIETHNLILAFPF